MMSVLCCRSEKGVATERGFVTVFCVDSLSTIFMISGTNGKRDFSNGLLFIDFAFPQPQTILV